MSDRAVTDLLEAEIAEVYRRRVSSYQGDVRCPVCNLRHDERQEYGCYPEGTAHRYHAGDLAAAEEIALSEDVEHVTVSVKELRDAIDKCDIDHDQRCCTKHKTHTSPHRGCILR